KEATSKKTLVIRRASFSPSEKSLIKKFVGKKNEEIVYDPTGNLSTVAAGNKRSYGKSIVDYYDFSKADYILSIGADFLGTWIAPEAFTKQFSSRRDPDGRMNRLVVAEPIMSLTGSNADSRLPIHAGSEILLGLTLAHELIGSSNIANKAQIANALKDYAPAKTASKIGITEAEIKKLVKELKANRGKSLVVMGGANVRYGSFGSAQVVANLLNQLLGNEGKTVSAQAPILEESFSSPKDIQKAISDLKSGKYKTVVIDRANPVFDMPNSGWDEALKSVENVIILDSHISETVQAVQEKAIVAALSHGLESWKDAYVGGVYTVAQPVIRPLFQTKSAGELWTLIAGEKEDFYTYLKEQVAPKFIGTFSEKDWHKTLAEGYKVKQKPGASNRTFKASALDKLKKIDPEQSEYKLVIYESVGLRDGYGANISFRHELPDPVTKVCWDNVAAVSPQDAKKNGWETGSMLEIQAGDKKITLPAFIQPGAKEGTIAVALGFGHSALGKVAKGVGQNVYALTDGYQLSGIPVTVKATGETYKIATTQRHHSMHGRALAQFATLEEYKKNPKEAGHHEPHSPGKGLYPGYEYKTYRWGMSIDLTKCTGCSACVTACYSENNIPAVGRDEIRVGREMSWMRIDRYYAGSEENPITIFQPVLCQHCENAPCENVCPVAATSHSDEGLNDIAYNRCIGTRYCLNNCPYKVRRFNWFENWEGKLQDPEQYALNPDVTVRSRGVIEKCSFCVQRINAARQKAKLENRTIADGELKTACQQGCPADAIVFGDRNNYGRENGKNEVIVRHENPRTYQLLSEINTKPMVDYMVKIRNEG
ncbi:MAG: 4Fe-4S dicluster domain-containing protein, partial [Candidatus Hydrogenedentota bacterium]